MRLGTVMAQVSNTMSAACKPFCAVCQQPTCKLYSATCVPAAHGGQICAPLDIVAAAIEEWTGQPCPELPQDGHPLMLQVGGWLCNGDAQPVSDLHQMSS